MTAYCHSHAALIRPLPQRVIVPRAGCQRGFTLIELIMVMVMLGVLAVFAAPRIFNSDDFYARGFHDETLGLLRFAQKAAVAARRTVCVAFTASTVTLTMAKDASTSDCSTPTPSGLTGPRGENPAAVPSTLKGITFLNGVAPTSFSFNGLGQPISAAGAALTTQTVIQISNAAKVYVEASTGYVHD